MEGMLKNKFYSSQKNIPCVRKCYKQNLSLSDNLQLEESWVQEVPIELFRGKCSRLTAHL